MNVTRRFHFVSSLLLAAALTAQTTPPSPTPEQVGADQAVAADGAKAAEQLAAWLQAERPHFECRVRKVKSEQAFTDGMIVMGLGGGGAPSFAGQVEIAGQDGNWAIVSKQQLPAVEVLTAGETSITRVTNGSEAIDASVLAGDLGSLLRTDKLIAAIGAAKWRKAADGKLTADLPANLVRQQNGGGGGGFGMPDFGRRVERVEVALDTAEDGTLRGFSLAVVRYDPMAAMQRKVAAGGAGGGGAMTPDQLEVPEDEREDCDYERDVYALTVSGEPVGPRLQKVFAELLQLAAKDGF